MVRGKLIVVMGKLVVVREGGAGRGERTDARGGMGAGRGEGELIMVSGEQLVVRGELIGV